MWVVGLFVGLLVGLVVGLLEGLLVGLFKGDFVGLYVGFDVIGVYVSTSTKKNVGCAVGCGLRFTGYAVIYFISVVLALDG
jgi:hypothetical protein